MTTKRDRLLLLHLSDLHFGPHSRFQDKDPSQLGKTLRHDLAEAQKHLAMEGKPDLVVVTGDIAESGKPTEFEIGAQFLTALAGELGCEHQRFVFVPGNHDISWPLCRKVELDQEEEDFDEVELRCRMNMVKLGRYEFFLKQFYGVDELSAVATPLECGAFVYNEPDLGLSIAALNSCEKESHRLGDHLGYFSQQQADALMKEWLAKTNTSRIKIIAIHHNPVRTVRSNQESWRNYLLNKGNLGADLVKRYEADVMGFEGWEQLRAVAMDTRAQLVLHGHHHAKDEQLWSWGSVIGSTHILSAGSLSLRSEVLPRDEPLSFRLILLDLEEKIIRTQSLVYWPRARTKGEVCWGAFIPDPAERDGYTQRLDLPEVFRSEDTGTGSIGQGTTIALPFIRTYRKFFEQSPSRWDLSVGVTPPSGVGRPIEITLDEMYQPLRLAEGFDFNDTERGAPIDAEALLARARPLVIRGAAGTGKTTWIRYTFRRLVELAEALPLMMVVRDLVQRWQTPGCEGEHRALDSFLDGWVAERLGKGWKGELKPFLEAEEGPRPVLLVDGWDEAGRFGEELREKLLGFMQFYPRLLVVVTSRPYGDSKPSSSDGFEGLDVQPLSNHEIEQFSHRFFLRCSGEEEALAFQEAQRFWLVLQSTPEPLGLARTPLLLTMMLLISRSRPLPEKRHLLYETCIESLLTALPDQKEAQGALLPFNYWRPGDSELRKRVVASLAFSLQDEGYKKKRRSSIGSTWEELEKYLPSAWSTTDRKKFIAWLSGPASLLSDRADGTLTFSHLSFQEYLCAWHLEANFQETRSQLFVEHIRDTDWWETLRLWAAMIEGQNPDRLDAIFETLSDHVLGFVLVGTMFADGLGSDKRFMKWTDWLVESLHEEWHYSLELCSRAWASSRQERRKALLERLEQDCQNLRWLNWSRRRAFLEDPSARLALPPPKHSLSRAFVEALFALESNGASRVDSVAVGRLLCGGPPIWPSEPLDLGLLNVWPGERRLLGLKLQAAAVSGATRDELKALVGSLALHSDKQEEVAHNFVRDFVRDLPHDFSLGLIRSFVCDFARYLLSDLVHLFDRDFAHDLVQYINGYLIAGDLGSESARTASRSFAHTLAREPFLDPGRDWLSDFSRLELFSHGRVAGRSFLAYVRHREASRELALLSEACRLSLDPDGDSRDFERMLKELPAEVDLVWPSLARHLARRSTREDRALLADLAQHPEKRRPPLSWGLQFIVRGDVMLEDGSVVTLDTLTDEAGLPRLPYLEDIPDELKTDWDAP